MPVRKRDRSKQKADKKWNQIVISIPMGDQSLKGSLEKIAEKNQRSLSNQICLVLRDFVSKHPEAFVRGRVK